MAGAVIAHFDVFRHENGENQMQQKIDIHGSEQFCIGRNAELCRHTFSESVISNRHLRIHCVLYEQDRIYETPPFVYATDMSRNGTYLRKSNIGCTSSQGRGVLMGQKSGAFLLDNGDELRMSDSLTLVYRSHIPPTASGLTALQKREARLFSSRFLLTDRILGIGGYGKVVIALHQKTQRQVACKIIKLSLNDSKPTALSLRHSTNGTRPKALPSRSAKCFREFDILKDLSHPNIITLEKVFWSSNSIYILEELVTGGDLFSYVEYKGGRLGDVQAAVIVRQILKGIEYLHDRDIVHRDLKPDNILMTSLDDGARIVITDFGNARALPECTSVSLDKLLHKQRMFSYAGTLEFAAPEIHKKNPLIPEDGGYSKSVDMWSVGCLTALLLSGDVIFTDRADPRYEKNPAAVILGLAATCNLSVLDDETHTIWSQVGSRPRSFIKKLLQLDESKRMTATESLHHPWFSDKKYAQEFHDLYQRSIRSWRPRPKIAQLVEPIAEISTSSLAPPEDHHHLLSQAMVSKFFAPPPARDPSPYNIHETLSIPPPPSPLPPITQASQEPPPPPPISLSAFNSLSSSSSLETSLETLSIEPYPSKPHKHPPFTAHDDDNDNAVLVRETPPPPAKRRNPYSFSSSSHSQPESPSAARITSSQFPAKQLSKRRKMAPLRAE